ncbi:MAG: transporter, partial [Gemmataceae bacterium]
VKAFSGKTGAVIRSLFAYDAGFAGGVSVAAADLDADGYADVVTGAGAGGGPHVKAFSGKTGAVIRSLFAYDAGFAGGVSVAAADLDADGWGEVITGAGQGGAPHVKAFDRAGGESVSFFAYAPVFAGGVSVAARDVDGDGVSDIVTGAGPGGGPHVAAFRGLTLDPLLNLYAFAPEFTGGVYVG